MNTDENTIKVQEMAVFMHQAFQRAKPHDYHKPFEETDVEYQRVMKSIAKEILTSEDQRREEAVEAAKKERDDYWLK